MQTITPIQITISCGEMNPIIIQTIDVQDEICWYDDYIDTSGAKIQFVNLLIKLAKLALDRVSPMFRYMKMDHQDHYKIEKIIKEKFVIDDLDLYAENYYETMMGLESVLADYLNEKYGYKRLFSVDINMGISNKLVLDNLNVIEWE